jgi:uncharacterized protein YecE (DUF72 family)
MIKVGLCGFTMAMTAYPEMFPVVEVQQTFYEPPANRVLERWVAAMPNGFEFTIKAWQLITHESRSPTYRRLKRQLNAEERAGAGGFRDSPIVREALERSIACAKVLGATRILFQSPASFRPQPENVQRFHRFFADIANPQRPTEVQYAWEPRGAAWTQHAELAVTLCRELGLDYVVDPFVDPVQPTPGRPAYLRLHGVTGARHVYTDAELLRLAGMVPPSAYVMFNNIPRVSDAKRFLALLPERAALASADHGK